MNEREILLVSEKTTRVAIRRAMGHKTFICSDNTANTQNPSANLLPRYPVVVQLWLSVTDDSIIRPFRFDSQYRSCPLCANRWRIINYRSADERT